MGVNLVSYAIRRQAGMAAREAEDVVNDFGRDPIGEGKEEQAWKFQLADLNLDLTERYYRYTIDNWKHCSTIGETMLSHWPRSAREGWEKRSESSWKIWHDLPWSNASGNIQGDRHTST
jgi:hypothetical protein